MSDKAAEPIIYIQVAASVGAVSPQSASSDFIEASSENLREVANLVKASWSHMVSDIENMVNPPSEIGVEFGIDVGAEGGIPFITKGSLGANFKVSIVWKKG